jgi:ribosome-binding ATPase YchF (GTP1/OBG family)
MLTSTFRYDTGEVENRLNNGTVTWSWKDPETSIRIIYPEVTYEALLNCNLDTLDSRREDMCINLIQSMLDANHKLHILLPNKVEDVRDRTTISNGDRLYNFSRIKRYTNRPIVYGINVYRFNQTLSQKYLIGLGF